jgi:cytochrome b561
MGHDDSSTIIGVVIAALVIWRIALRVKRLTSRQPVRLWSLRLRAVFLFVFAIAAGLISARQPLVLAALCLGIAGGVAAGIYGLRGSTFENTANGLFYTPHRGLGAIIALIFVARIGYRFFHVLVHGPAARNTQAATDTFQALDLTPLTMGLFGLLAGYVVCYSIGILRWRERAQVEPAAAPVPGDAARLAAAAAGTEDKPGEPSPG